jgi:hypothetical protein
MTSSSDDQVFSRLFKMIEEAEECPPSSLTARLYSTIIREQSASGSLSSLNASVAKGYGICVFEKLVQIAPIGDAGKSRFFCHVCHARVLAERFDNPPIFWPNCPYAAFSRS